MRLPKARSGVVLNSASSVAEFLFRPLLLLATTPLYISHLGVAGYGVWFFLLTIINLTGLLGLGVADATIKFVASAGGDQRRITAIFGVSFTLAIAFGGLSAGCALLFRSLIVSEVLQPEPEMVAATSMALVWAAVGLFGRSLESVPQALLQGFQRYDLNALVTVPCDIAMILLGALLLHAGFGLQEIALQAAVWPFVSLLLKFIVARRSLAPTLSLVPRFNITLIQEILPFGLFSWLQSMTTVTLGQLDRILIPAILGPAALGVYAVCLQIAIQANALFARGAAFLFPLSSAAVARGDGRELRALYVKATAVISVVSVGIVVPLILLAPWGLELWLGKDIARQAAPILPVMLVATGTMSTSAVSYYLLNGGGHIRLNTGLNVLSNVMLCIAMIILMPLLGLFGAAAARLAQVPVAVLSRSLVQTKMLEDPRWYLGPMMLLPPFLITVCTYFLHLSIPAPTSILAGLLIAALAGTIGAIAAAALWWLGIRMFGPNRPSPTL